MIFSKVPDSYKDWYLTKMILPNPVLTYIYLLNTKTPTTNETQIINPPVVPRAILSVLSPEKYKKNESVRKKPISLN